MNTYMKDVLLYYLLVVVENGHVLHLVLLLFLKHIAVLPHELLLDLHKLLLQDSFLQCAHNAVEKQIIPSAVAV